MQDVGATTAQVLVTEVQFPKTGDVAPVAQVEVLLSVMSPDCPSGQGVVVRVSVAAGVQVVVVCPTASHELYI